MKFFSSYLLCILIILNVSCSNKDFFIEEAEPNTHTESPNLLLQLNGNQIVDANKKPVYLQGVAFGNEIWSNSALPPKTHHNELDYQRVNAMGMNAIRFYLNYKTFEDDANPYVYKQSGWDWIDKNIEWAKKNDIYLILNMHAPQGGYQSQGNGDDLWDNPDNQNRLVALWTAIAKHYKDEVQIAGFGPVNEPVPNKSLNQWSSLAQKLINGIRSVNKHHFIFIERAIYIKNENNYDNTNFPTVTGENIIYEFHGYDPYLYTHQLFDWAKLGDGGKYPDEDVIEFVDGNWYSATFNNPSLNEGTNDWSYFEAEKYQIIDDKIKVAYLAIVGAKVGGTVYFDDITINEYDENGVFTRTIADLNLASINNWYFWSANNTGTYGLSTNIGHNDNLSLFIKNASDDCNLSNTALSFIPIKNYYYQINGWMKGENVANNANCKIRLDFLTSDYPILKRNKNYLVSVLQKYIDFAKTKNVPLYMGEFGAGAPCFENNKGGLQFVEDMVSIAKSANIHFTYHAYHEDSFGLYKGSETLPNPNNSNQPLIDLFTKLLN
jgi:endoglucanase